MLNKLVLIGLKYATLQLKDHNSYGYTAKHILTTHAYL